MRSKREHQKATLKSLTYLAEDILSFAKENGGKPDQDAYQHGGMLVNTALCLVIDHLPSELAAACTDIIEAHEVLRVAMYGD